jgi:hypothetical protein
MRSLAFGFLLGGLLVLGGELRAQTPVELADGMTFELPGGWKTTILDTTSKAGQSVSFDELTPLVVLVHARPEDSGRGATFTVIRDNSLSRDRGLLAGKQDAIVRIRELAASQGYRAEKVTIQTQEHEGSTFIRAEVQGVNADGGIRHFLAASILGHTVTYRCYWQADDADSALQSEFAAWLDSVALKGEKIAPLIAAGQTLSTDNTDVASAKSSVSSKSADGGSQPGAATPTPSPTPAPLSAAVVKLVDSHRNSLIVIEGKKGVGSGFLCNVEGKPMLFTNTHVMCGNPQAAYSRMSGGKVAPKDASLAVGADICRMAAPDATATLEYMPDMHSTVKIGDEVVVLGNAEGAGVVKPLEGKVVGIGPNLVEVDAPFVPGNSGSPIVHVPTGKVIGIATYLLIRKVSKDKEAMDSEIRRFGYRLDTVPSWEALDWRAFDFQAAQLAKIEATSAEFIQLFEDSAAKRVSYSNFDDPGIRRALESYSRALRGSRMSESDFNNVRRSFFGDLRRVAQGDINAFDSRTAYDYFRRAVETEKKMRDDVCAAFTKAIESTRN